jgi:hypothetical protein
MITRDPDTHDITVTPDDIPALAALVITARDNLKKDKEKIPGSLTHIYDRFIDVADRFENAVDKVREF